MVDQYLNISMQTAGKIEWYTIYECPDIQTNQIRN